MVRPGQTGGKPKMDFQRRNNEGKKIKNFVPRKKTAKATEEGAADGPSNSKGSYKSAYKRAQETFQKLQQERREKAELARKEKEKRRDAMNEYQSIKQKMNKALCKRNKKGQPKLDAQVAVLLEKIERRVSK